MPLSKKKCEIQPAVINLHSNEYSKELHYHPVDIKLDRYAGSCSTLNDLSKKLCAPNKTENLNTHFLNMITGINKPNILTKYISCECKCKFDGKKRCNSNQKWNNDKCQCESKKHHVCENDYIWNLLSCSCESVKYLASITNDNSEITCDEITEERKTIATNFNSKDQLVKH